MCTITNNERLKLIGLLTLANGHRAALDRIEEAAAEVTREPNDGYNYFGLTSDAIYSPQGNDPAAEADALLKRLEITVEATASAD